MKRAVETTEDFKARIAAMIGDKTEQIVGACRQHPMLGAQEARHQNAETATTMMVTKSVHEYEVGPRKDRRGVDLISDALPFGRLWYGEANASSETEKIRACIINPSPFKIVA